MDFPLLGIFNELDAILIIILFLGCIFGMTRGAMPQFISAVSIWLGLVLALWIYTPLSRSLIRGLFQSWAPQTTDAIAFFCLFVVFSFFVRLVVTYVIFPPADEEKRLKAEKKRRERREQEGIEEPFIQRFVFGPLNLIGGLILGFVLTTFWWAIILGMLQFVLQPDLLQGFSSFMLNVAGQLQRSYLVDNLFNSTLYWLLSSIRLFAPPPGTIFSPVDGNIVEQIFSTILFTRA